MANEVPFAECVQNWIIAGHPATIAYTLCKKGIHVPDSPQAQNAVVREYGQGDNLFSMQNLIIFAVVARLSKTPEGLKVLRDVAVQAIRTMGDTMEAIAKASVGNPISAWANPYLLSIVFERFGIVPHERMAEFRIGLSLISGAEVAEDVIKSLSGFRLFSIGEVRHQPEEFPTHINFGDKVYRIEPSLAMRLEKPTKKKK